MTTNVTVTPVYPQPATPYALDDLSNVSEADLLAAGTAAGLADDALANVANADLLSRGVAAGLATATPASSSQTIASDAITVTAGIPGLITLDTEGGASTDNLATINGGSAGQILVLRPTSGTRVITVKDATGNINLPGGDFVLNSAVDTVTLIRTNTKWIAIATANNA